MIRVLEIDLPEIEKIEKSEIIKRENRIKNLNRLGLRDGSSFSF